MSCSSRKWARSPPSAPMTADRASIHSRVSWASVSFAAAPMKGSGMADMACLLEWFLRMARSLAQLAEIFKSCELISYSDIQEEDGEASGPVMTAARPGVLRSLDNPHHAIKPQVHGAAAQYTHTAASTVRPLVAPAVAGPARPLRHARAADLRAVVSRGHHFGLLVFAQRGIRTRTGVRQARHRD